MSKRKAEKEKEKVIGFRYPSKIPSLEDAAKSIGKFENNVIPPGILYKPLFIYKYLFSKR